MAHDERCGWRAVRLRAEVGREELTNHMAGGAELAALTHELAQVRGVDTDELPEEEDLTV